MDALQLLQRYRPSHVPHELIEQIAAVVEAKAFLHVVSVSIQEPFDTLLAKRAVSSSTPRAQHHNSHLPVQCVPH